MLHLLLKWLTTMDRAEETVEQATGGGRREEGGRRQPIAGKINILALAAHGSNRHWCSRETRQSDQGTAIKKKGGGGRTSVDPRLTIRPRLTTVL